MKIIEKVLDEIKRRRFIKRKLALLEDPTYFDRIEKHNLHFSKNSFPNSYIMNERREKINR